MNFKLFLRNHGISELKTQMSRYYGLLHANCGEID